LLGVEPPMNKLKMDDLEVRENYIHHIAFPLGRVWFYLIAPEEEGKRLETKLTQLKEQHAIEFSATNSDGESSTGLCNLKQLSIHRDTSKAPVLYRIHGELELIT